MGRVYVHPPGPDMDLVSSIVERILAAHTGDLSGVESCKRDLDFFFALCEAGCTNGYAEHEGPKRPPTGQA